MNTSTHSPTYRHLDLERDLIPLVKLLNEIKQAEHDDDGVSERLSVHRITPHPLAVAVVRPSDRAR